MMTLQTHFADTLPSRILREGDDIFLYFSGTSYLGVGCQPTFRAALTTAMTRQGTIFSASRNGNLQLSVYDHFEQHLADWVGAAAALTVSSGLLAGQLAVRTMPPSAQWHYAPNTHTAIWAHDTITTPSNDFDTFIEYFFTQYPAEQTAVIACNSVDPLRCLPINFDWVTRLETLPNVHLLIDDSHGLGLLGRDGRSVYDTLQRACSAQLMSRITVVSSLAKAMGLAGGVILGTAARIAAVRRNPFFGGASPMLPAYAEATLAAWDSFGIWRERLLRNIAFFKALLIEKNLLHYFRFLPDYPVFYCHETALVAALYEEKIFISAFHYPAPTDPLIVRIIVSALHEKLDLERLATVIAVALQK